LRRDEEEHRGRKETGRDRWGIALIDSRVKVLVIVASHPSSAHAFALHPDLNVIAAEIERGLAELVEAAGQADSQADPASL
jgi:hypothetical protein